MVRLTLRGDCRRKNRRGDRSEKSLAKKYFLNHIYLKVSYLLENDREFLKRIIKGEMSKEEDHFRRQ